MLASIAVNTEIPKSFLAEHRHKNMKTRGIVDWFRNFSVEETSLFQSC